MSTETAVKSRPIIFSAAMVQAILAGRKTQTRRALKPQPDIQWGSPPARLYEGYFNRWGCHRDKESIRCPYHEGQELWVKEACLISHAKDEVVRVGHERYEEFRADKERYKLTSPIHMPRWASRITLRIESVRVERVQEASVIDLVAEGCVSKFNGAYWATDPSTGERLSKDFREYWQQRWTNLRGPESWLKNEWVWVIQFTSLTPARREQEKK